MVVLGVVLLVIVVVFAVAVVISNPEVVNLNVFNALVPVTMAGVFFTGAGALLVVLIASLFIQRGIARSAKLRRQQRALASTPATAPAEVPAAAPAAPPTPAPPAADADPTPPRANGSHAITPAASIPAPAPPQVTPPSAPVTRVITEADDLARDEPLR